MNTNNLQEACVNNSSTAPACASPAVFNNPEFGSVRVIMKDGEPLFCLRDVCDILEVGKTSDVKDRLGDDTVVTIAGINPKNLEQGVIFVNEDGLYDVILDSRKPEAKRFRKWVTSEVLPSIRRLQYTLYTYCVRRGIVSKLKFKDEL